MDITFRPLIDADLALLSHWLQQPHVHKWWQDPADLESVTEKYGERAAGDSATKVFVVEVEGKPIGIIQCYPMDSEPETATLLQVPDGVGVDYLIGDVDYIGRGYGSRMIDAFIKGVVRSTYPDATTVATSVDVENIASLRALEKCGFSPAQVITGDHGRPERVMKLVS